MSGEQLRCGNGEIWCWPNFDTLFDPVWHIELFMCAQRVACVIRQWKFTFVLFKSGKMQSTEWRWLNLHPSGKVPSTISLRRAKKIVIIVFLVPVAWRVLGMTCVSGRANIFQGGQEYWNQNSSPVAIPSKWFSSDSCRNRGISVDALALAIFLGGPQEMGHQRRENVFRSRFLWKISLIIGLLGHWPPFGAKRC
jgi:hypothetical protein